MTLTGTVVRDGGGRRAAGNGAEDGDLRLSGHDESVALGAAEPGDRKGDRLQDQLAPVRRRRRRDPRDGVGRRAARRSRLDRHRDRDQPGHGRRALLDSRGHRGGRSAGRAQRQRRQHRSPTSRARRSARRSCRRRTSSCSYAMQKAGLKPTDVQVLNMRPPEIAAAWEPRRHRRDVHLGSGAHQRQEERQGADDVGRHLQAGRLHVRRPDRHAQVRQGESGVHGRAGQGARQGRRRLPRQPQGVDRRSGQGRGGRQVVGRQARGRRRRDGALRLPQPAGAGVADLARRRRERRGVEGADAAGQLPEGARTADRRSRPTTARA